MTLVREKLEDPAYWGFFLRKKNATGTTASKVLYHDHGGGVPYGATADCGKGVQCGEYLWDVRRHPCCLVPHLFIY